MTKYINKVIELFTRVKSKGGTDKHFYDWLVDDASDKEEKDVALFHLWNEPNSISQAEAQSAFDTFRQNNTPKTKTNKVILWRYAAAIALLVCATTAYIFTQNISTEVNFVEHYSPIGKIDSLTLPDGSVVETNSSTVLVYSSDFGTNNRTLYLTGEANFKVVKNKKIPFIVKSKQFAVTALGTEFNVASYPDDVMFRTTLIEGSVKVEENESNVGHVLNVSDQFTYNKETKEQAIVTANIGDVTAWQRGELVFRGTTIREITKVLERRYGVTFHFKADKEDTDKYNFRFKKDATLPELMDIIKNVATDFDYKINDDLCYIY